MKHSDLKTHLYNQCIEFIDRRLKTLQNNISEIQESLLSETKSSAGDKHETGRAMLQLEREKAGQQLAEVQRLQEILHQVDNKTISKNVALGSLVHTNAQNYYIAISAGALLVQNKTYYAISPATPIANVLLGKQKGDAITFRSSTFVITDVS